MDIAWDAYTCWCQECRDSERYYVSDDHPAVVELVKYSRVALQESMSRVMAVHPDHDMPPDPQDWLDLLKARHAEMRGRELDARDLDVLAGDSSRARRPPARRLGRSPSSYSRGR